MGGGRRTACRAGVDVQMLGSHGVGLEREVVVGVLPGWPEAAGAAERAPRAGVEDLGDARVGAWGL